LTSEKLALEAAKIVEEKKGKDIVLLDIRDISIISDYFLICSAESSVQMKVIARELEEKLTDKGACLLNAGDYLNDYWILMDFGDLVVHIFSPEKRSYYELERVWADAKRKEIRGISRGEKKVRT